MVMELRDAAPLLAESDQPIETVLVDLRSPDNSGSSGGSGGRGGSHGSSRRRGGESGNRNSNSLGPDPTGLDTASAKRQLVAETGLPIGDFGGQELR